MKCARMRSISVGGKVGAFLADALPFCFDLTAVFFDAEGVDEDLDAGLVDVIAAAMQIVDAQHGLQIGEQILLRQERLHLLGDVGRAALAAADKDLEAFRGVRSADDADADVVEGDRRAVLQRAGDGELELARQVGEFGVVG